MKAALSKHPLLKGDGLTKVDPKAKLEKLAAKDHGPTAFATQLAVAQALAPQAPLHLPSLSFANKHHKENNASKTAPRVEASTASRAIVAPERPQVDSASRAPHPEMSSQTVAAFSLNEVPQARDVKTALDAPPPMWAPKEMVEGDTARMTLFPHHLQWTNENGAMSVQVKNGEVSIRAQGELAMSLRVSEAELRVSLAQEGLTLRDTESTSRNANDDASSDQRRQQNPQNEDE